MDLAPLIERLATDVRVLGVARLHTPTPAGAAPRAPVGPLSRLLVATTWDGFEPLAAALPELVALVLTGPDVVVDAHGGRAEGLAPDGARVEIALERMADLKPEPRRGLGAEPLFDPRGLLAQWAEWSAGKPPDAPSPQVLETERRRRILRADDVLRAVDALDARVVPDAGGARALRDVLGERARAALARLGDGPAESALRARAARVLAAVPRAPSGIRASRADGDDDARERFLAVADAEGFAGDRVLLDAAEARLAALLGRAAVFEEGFALPSFDQVEARYALGEAVGGCKPPLVPGVHVGVGVTPDDRLEFWAAPCVREPLGHVACVADDGRRDVRSRDAGRDALVAALCDAVEDAYEALPALLRRARGAHLERIEDARAALRPLHLPASHVAAALAAGLPERPTRLELALSVARAGTCVAPIAARKLALAAGRVLRAAPEVADADCPA